MPGGFLTSADRGILTAYCLTWSLYLDSLEVIDREGMLSTGSAGQVVMPPALAAADRAAARLLALSDRLGLNPAARSRLDLPPPELPPGPGDDLLRG